MARKKDAQYDFNDNLWNHRESIENILGDLDYINKHNIDEKINEYIEPLTQRVSMLEGGVKQIKSNQSYIIEMLHSLATHINGTTDGYFSIRHDDESSTDCIEYKQEIIKIDGVEIEHVYRK